MGALELEMRGVRRVTLLWRYWITVVYSNKNGWDGFLVLVGLAFWRPFQRIPFLNNKNSKYSSGFLSANSIKVWCMFKASY